VTTRALVRIVLPFLLAPAAAGPAAGQVCVRDRPSPTCRVTVVTEFGALMAFEDELRRTPGVHSVFWELGLMRTLGSGRRALGGTLYLSYDETDLRHVLAGIKLRGRTELHPLVSLTGSVGILFAGNFGRSPDTPRATLPGVTSRLDLGILDWGALSIGLDAYGVDMTFVDTEPGVSRLRDQRTTWFLGLKVGGWLGLIAGPVAAGLIHLGNTLAGS
jgi:hypothetical protein